MLKHNPVGCPTVMFRQDVFNEVGPFDEKIKHCADIAMWIKICMFHDVAYIAEPLIKIRRHEGQDSTRFLTGYRNAEQIYTATVTPLNDYANQLPKLREMRKEFHRNYLQAAVQEVAELSRSGNLKTVAGILCFVTSKNPALLLTPTAIGAFLRSIARSISNRAKSRPTGPSQDLNRP
jgi:hypothetical protein